MLITVPEGMVAADMDLLAPLLADEDAEDEDGVMVAGLGTGTTAVEGAGVTLALGVTLARGVTLALGALVMKLML
jgi:hypothetical protein